MALFSSARPQQSSHLVEFRAGKMFTRGGGETGAPITVHPDKRKGLVYVSRSDDGLMHFCWKDRTTGVVEDDLIVFPDDVEFVRVDQCTTGRVFLLKFKNSTRKLFFWMQEPKDDKDEEFRRKVNDLLNNPQTSGRGARGGGGQDSDQFSMMNQLLGLGGSGGGASEERMDLQNALAGMDQQQLMQLLNLMGSGGGGGPSFGSFMESTPPTAPAPRRTAPAATIPTTTQPATSAAQSTTAGQQGATAVATEVREGASAAPGAPRPPTDSHQVIQVTDLRNILANLGAEGTVPTQPTGEAAVDLEVVLAAKNIEQSVRKPGNEARLLPHLPDEEPIEKTREELLLTIRSPQFRQAVDMFGTALQTGQLAPLMSQFGLPPSALEACARGDIQSVAEILERESGGASAGTAAGTDKDKDKKKKEEGKGAEPPPKKDKQDDENMDLD